MKHKLGILKQYMAAGMLLLFVAYYVDVNFFVHSHIVNGVTIVHSHIHKSNHGGKTGESHSATEINLIAQSAIQFLMTEAHGQAAIDAYYKIVDKLGAEQAHPILTAYLVCISLRAPPMQIG